MGHSRSYLCHQFHLNVLQVDDDKRAIAAAAVGEVARHAPEALKIHASRIVPIAFAGSHDCVEETRQVITLLLYAILDFRIVVFCISSGALSGTHASLEKRQASARISMVSLHL